jgi:putative hydrolase of the HAD superfamily
MAFSRQTLLIDADDTLWENNIYFERAIAGFISFLNHQEFSPQQVREVLNQVEHECIRKHGYGLRSFRHALVDTFERLSVEPLTPALHETIQGFAHVIADHEIEIIAEVPATLEYLQGRHRLILMTKGDPEEQAQKVERSGLKHHFEAIEVVADKNARVYREIIAKHGLVESSTWMIGNSPKSDINPALAAGIHAVFVPHAQTWVLEHEEVCGPAGQCRLLVLERFAQLREHF